MYAYSHDSETGGLLLTDTPSSFSKEPRPVYSRELDILGFGEYWKYEQRDDAPYLWAESNFYWYRGQRVAKTSGGSLYEKPSIELEKDENGVERLPAGSVLIPVDIPRMVEKNRVLLEVLELQTIKKIFDVYRRYKSKLDCFHVAFSGGKDSIVLLELVKSALPPNAFLVVFGDTGMEFPDTYQVVEAVEAECKAEGIAFYRAASHLKPEESWKLFGPPSRVLRWCCSVHKSVPQTLKIREVLGKVDYRGMDFVGVRVHESAKRSTYEYENYGKKQRGQYSHNPILEWSSAEIWQYIYLKKLIINTAYFKGHSRVGCLFCPQSGDRSNFLRYYCYPKEVGTFINLIKETVSDKNIDSYISNRGWIERKNGRDLKLHNCDYVEETKDGILYIKIKNPKTDWRIWILTLGKIPFEYKIHEKKDFLMVEIPTSAARSPMFKVFKQVFHKTISCISCGTCVSNCQHGSISFEGGLHIDSCTHCGQCHTIDNGCIAYHSLQQPKNGGFIMKSLNTFSDHAPKIDWINDFFKRGNDFLIKNSLGPMQISLFRRFLTDAGLICKNKTTDLFNFAQKLGINSENLWAILFNILVHSNPQMRWYVKNLTFEKTYSCQEVINQLTELSVSEKDARSILKAFKRFCETPLGTKLKFGTAHENNRKLESIKRCKPLVQDSRVVLYSLYKFAEACDGYYEFTLSRLMDFTVESSGVSPAEIFGFSRDEMEQILHGLARTNPDFLSFTTTHDLEIVRLSDDKTSENVLEIF